MSQSQSRVPKRSQKSGKNIPRSNSNKTGLIAFDSQQSDEVNFHPLPIAGILAALYAVLAGFLFVFLVVFVVWLLAAHGDESTVEVLRASGVAWLSTHLITVIIGGNPFGLLPWAFTAVPFLALRKSMFWAIKSARPQELYEYWLLAGFVTLGYGTVALFISMFAGTPDLFTRDLNALTHSLLLAALVTGMCIWQDSRAHQLVMNALPTEVKAGVRPGLFGAAFLFMVGGITCTVSLALQFQQVRAVTGLIAPNSLDALFLTLLGIGYIPTTVAWCTAYLIGPGIYVGSDAIINVSSIYQGRLPAFPLLAILPTEPQQFARYFILVPIATGVLIYVTTVRERWYPSSSSFLLSAFSTIRMSEIFTLLASILTLGAVVLVVCAASSGPLGLKLLDYVGPNAVSVARQAIVISGLSAMVMIILPRVLLTALWAIKHKQSTHNN